MFYLPLASVHAEARYEDLLREAEIERERAHARSGGPGRMWQLLGSLVAFGAAFGYGYRG